MSYVKGVATGLLGLSMLGLQELPSEISMRPGQEIYCKAPLKDLKGNEFPGVVRAYRATNGDVTTFYVVQESATYKAPTDESAFKYGTPQRATITISGRKIDEVTDVVAIDGDVYFGGSNMPVNLMVPAEGIRFVNDVFRCIANKKN